MIHWNQRLEVTDNPRWFSAGEILHPVLTHTDKARSWLVIFVSGVRISHWDSDSNAVFLLVDSDNVTNGFSMIASTAGIVKVSETDINVPFFSVAFWCDPIFFIDKIF